MDSESKRETTRGGIDQGKVRLALPWHCGHLAITRMKDINSVANISLCCYCFRVKWGYWWEQCSNGNHTHDGESLVNNKGNGGIS